MVRPHLSQLGTQLAGSARQGESGRGSLLSELLLEHILSELTG